MQGQTLPLKRAFVARQMHEHSGEKRWDQTQEGFKVSLRARRPISSQSEWSEGRRMEPIGQQL